MPHVVHHTPTPAMLRVGTCQELDGKRGDLSLVLIDQDLCISCAACIPYCPISALSLGSDSAVVDADRCTDCYACVRPKICPTDALSPGPLPTFYDHFRHILSDPTETTAESGVPGRGTEESKTNDVTGRTRRGEVGVAIDMGRPGVGVRLDDVEKVAQAVIRAGLKLEGPEVSPLGKVLKDIRTGEVQDKARNLHLLSIIIEGSCCDDQLKAVLEALQNVEDQIDTVFSVGLSLRPDATGGFSQLSVLSELGIPVPVRAKVNVGLGRPLVEN